MPKLRLFATVDLGHNGSVNTAVWEVIYPIKNNGKFSVPQIAKDHDMYSIIGKSIKPILESGKCILFTPYGLGWNDCIKKTNASDFYFAENINGKHIINLATETLIQEVKELL